MRVKSNYRECRHKYHERVSSNLNDAVLLLHYSTNVQSTGDIKLAEEGIKCLQVSLPLNHPFAKCHVDNIVLGNVCTSSIY